MIKEMEEYCEKRYKKYLDSGYETFLGEYKGATECIEIAKKHKKKKKDKCEWKSENSAIFSKIHSNKHNANLFIDKTCKYCPYRGKKIKVVDEDWMGYTE